MKLKFKLKSKLKKYKEEAPPPSISSPSPENQGRERNPRRCAHWVGNARCTRSRSTSGKRTYTNVREHAPRAWSGMNVDSACRNGRENAAKRSGMRSGYARNQSGTRALWVGNERARLLTFFSADITNPNHSIIFSWFVFRRKLREKEEGGKEKQRREKQQRSR